MTPFTRRLWNEYCNLLRGIDSEDLNINFQLIEAKEHTIRAHGGYRSHKKEEVDRLTSKLMALGRLGLYARYGDNLEIGYRQIFEAAADNGNPFQGFKYCTRVAEKLREEEKAVAEDERSILAKHLAKNSRHGETPPNNRRTKFAARRAYDCTGALIMDGK